MSRVNTLFQRIGREEAGFGVLEVLASALLVAMLAVGVFKTFDAANAASGNTRARALAADLAQQDQERMRALRASELSDINGVPPTTRKVAGITYTVASSATWVNDMSGSRRCGLASGRADYIRINSSVTWPRMMGAAPVTSTSLYAPPSGSFGDEGNLGFEILNRSAVGVPGVTVTLSGPANRTGSTDSAGCIFFPFLPQGTYTATINKAGYVDYQGNATITKTYGLEGGTSQVQPLDYDQAGTVVVNVKSRRNSGTDVNAQATDLTVGHSQLASPGTRVFGNGSTRLGSFGAAQGLNTFFPFTSAYSIHTGDCDANKGLPPGTTAPALRTVTVTPGGTQTVNVNEPGLRIFRYTTANSNSGASAAVAANSKITLTPRSPGCSGTLNLYADSQGYVSPVSGATNVTNPDPGVPYGVYDICVTHGGKRRSLNNFTLNVLNGETATAVSNLNSDPNGSCW